MHELHQKCYKKFTKDIAIELNEKSKREKEKSTSKRTQRTGLGSKQVFSPICMFCKSGDQKRTYVKKLNYWYGKILELEFVFVEEFF